MLIFIRYLVITISIFESCGVWAQSIVTAEQCAVRLHEVTSRVLQAHASLSRCLRGSTEIGPGETCDVVDYRMISARLKAWPQCDDYERALCSAGRARQELTEACERLHKVKISRELTDKAEKLREATNAVHDLAKFDANWAARGFAYALKKRANELGLSLLTTVGGESMARASGRLIKDNIPTWNPNDPGSMSSEDRRKLEFFIDQAKRGLGMEGNPIQDMFAVALKKQVELEISGMDYMASVLGEMQNDFGRSTLPRELSGSGFAPIEKRVESSPPIEMPLPRPVESSPPIEKPVRRPIEVDTSPMGVDACAREFKSHDIGMSIGVFKKRCRNWISKSSDDWEDEW